LIKIALSAAKIVIPKYD